MEHANDPMNPMFQMNELKKGVKEGGKEGGTEGREGNDGGRECKGRENGGGGKGSERKEHNHGRLTSLFCTLLVLRLTIPNCPNYFRHAELQRQLLYCRPIIA